VDVADPTLGVDQVVRRPVLVGEGIPGRKPVVLGHRIAEAISLDRRGDVRGLALERELRRVDAHDREPVAAIGGVERP
jgi:hypothetical protein